MEHGKYNSSDDSIAAAAHAWKRLHAVERRKLLERLNPGASKLMPPFKIKRVAGQSDWWKLPIPLQTFLGSHFDGETGKFSTGAFKDKMQSAAVLMKSLDEADRRYENAPDV